MLVSFAQTLNTLKMLRTFLKIENMCILFAAKKPPTLSVASITCSQHIWNIVCALFMHNAVHLLVSGSLNSKYTYNVVEQFGSVFSIQYSHVVQSPHRIQNSNGNSKLFRFCLLTIFFIVFFFFFFQLQVLFSLFALISNRSIIQKQSMAQFEFWNWFWSQLRCSFCYYYCWLSLSFCWNAMLFIKKHSCAIYDQYSAFLFCRFFR